MTEAAWESKRGRDVTRKRKTRNIERAWENGKDRRAESVSTIIRKWNEPVGHRLPVCRYWALPLRTVCNKWYRHVLAKRLNTRHPALDWFPLQSDQLLQPHPYLYLSTSGCCTTQSLTSHKNQMNPRNMSFVTFKMKLVLFLLLFNNRLLYIIISLDFQRFLLTFASIENLFNHNYPIWKRFSNFEGRKKRTVEWKGKNWPDS